jgi:hypothetical protein
MAGKPPGVGDGTPPTPGDEQQFRSVRLKTAQQKARCERSTFDPEIIVISILLSGRNLSRQNYVLSRLAYLPMGYMIFGS